MTDRRYDSLVQEQLPNATILAEPVGRNTAAAIALATVAIERLEDEVMLVLPADQTIKDVPVFQGVLRDAEQELALGSLVSDPLVTLGVEIKRAATEYGYLIPNRATEHVGKLTAYVLEAFQEKPSAERAEELRRQGGGIAWNAGMFMWQRRAIRTALEAFAPEVLDLVATRLQCRHPGRGLRRGPVDLDRLRSDGDRRQRTDRVVMGAMDVGWNDLGSWTSLLGELGMPGVEATIDPTGEAFAANPEDLLIWRNASGRLIAMPGSDATMVAAAGPVAVLRDAHALQSRIEPLLDRCSMLEAHS